MVTSTKRKPKNASVTAQKAWLQMPEKLKKELRKQLPDSDKDKAPNGFDCRPLNPKKQESFLPEDRAFVKSHNVVKIKESHGRTKVIGAGTSGFVLPVSKSNRMVLKLEKEGAFDGLKTEASFHKQHRLSRLPLFTPMKEVKTSSGHYAVLKPVVKPIVEPSGIVKSQFTDSRLKEIRKKLINLSYRGFIFNDGLQLGIDKAGRLLQFDVGGMEHIPPSSSGINNMPFYENNREWRELLRMLGKSTSVYGKIERSSELDKISLARAKRSKKSSSSSEASQTSTSKRSSSSRSSSSKTSSKSSNSSKSQSIRRG